MMYRAVPMSLLLAMISGCASNLPSALPTRASDQRPTEYQPQRVGPTAMEAWIAPWEDATGDLYPPSTVYIEVNPQSWQYSGESTGHMTVLRPLQVEQRPPREGPAPVAFPVPQGAGDMAPFMIPQTPRGA